MYEPLKSQKQTERDQYFEKLRKRNEVDAKLRKKLRSMPFPIAVLYWAFFVWNDDPNDLQASPLRITIWTVTFMALMAWVVLPLLWLLGKASC